MVNVYNELLYSGIPISQTKIHFASGSFTVFLLLYITFELLKILSAKQHGDYLSTQGWYQIYQRLQDVCSRDLDQRAFIPFGGPGTIVKCDKSKFNHEAKVRLLVESPKL